MARLSAPTERAMQDLGSIKVSLKVFDTYYLWAKRNSEEAAEGAQLLSLSALGAVLEKVSASREADPVKSLFPSLHIIRAMVKLVLFPMLV